MPDLIPVPVLKKPGSEFQFGFGSLKKLRNHFQFQTQFQN
jgi:hypothetical protein